MNYDPHIFPFKQKSQEAPFMSFLEMATVCLNYPPLILNKKQEQH